MKTIRLNFCDFSRDFKIRDNYFFNLLSQKYAIEISDNPEFVICSIYGMNFLKYNCVRIFYTGENYTPNFNLYDYGMGFDWLDFGERYLRVPLYFIRNKSQHYQQCFNYSNFKETDLKNRKFCNFVYSNKNANKIREYFFKDLSKYKFVHSGGKYLNNIGAPIDNKLEFLKDFKFTIAFENSSTIGYTTEKILEAKVAGTIPIYWGNPSVNKELNTKAFINCHDFPSMEKVIEYIKFLDNNNNEFLKILNEPLFKKEIYELSDNIVLNFFENIFEKNEIQRKGHFQTHLEKKYKQYQIIEKIKRFKPINYMIKKTGL